MKRVAIAFVLLLSAVSTAAADPIADFYAGKTLRMLVGYGPGGGYDIYGRLVAEFLPKYLPGHPSIITENMPGAGSFAAAKYIANVAPKDGTVLASLAQTFALDSAVGGSGKTNAADFHYVGRVTTNIDIGVARASSGIKSIADVRTKQYTVGASGRGSTTDIYAEALNAYGGTKFKIVLGYKGTSEILLAMERGEVDIDGAYGLPGMLVTHPDWIKGGATLLSIRRRSNAARCCPMCRRWPNWRFPTRAGRSCAPSHRRRKSAARSSAGPACRRSGWRRCARPLREW